MQPDKASAVMAAIIDNRNARTTRTGPTPRRRLGFARLWLRNRSGREFAKAGIELWRSHLAAFTRLVA
jgi:hypothetical protein